MRGERECNCVQSESKDIIIHRPQSKRSNSSSSRVVIILPPSSLLSNYLLHMNILISVSIDSLSLSLSLSKIFESPRSKQSTQQQHVPVLCEDVRRRNTRIIISTVESFRGSFGSNQTYILRKTRLCAREYRLKRGAEMAR